MITQSLEVITGETCASEIKAKSSSYVPESLEKCFYCTRDKNYENCSNYIRAKDMHMTVRYGKVACLR